MELVILGTGAAFPGPGHASSGYLIRQDHASLLIDCGNGVVSRLQQAGEFEGLTSLLFSHLHADHCLDIFSLFYGRAYNRGRSYPPLPVYLPPGEVDRLGQLAEVMRVEPHRMLDGVFKVSEYDPDAGLQMDGLKLSFARTEHPLPTYSVRVEGGEGSFVYSSDTSSTQHLGQLARGCNLLLCESTIREPDLDPNNPIHLTPQMAGGVAAQAGARRLLLTHFWSGYDREAMLEEAREVFPDTELAEELRRYTIP